MDKGLPFSEVEGGIIESPPSLSRSNGSSTGLSREEENRQYRYTRTKPNLWVHGIMVSLKGRSG